MTGKTAAGSAAGGHDGAGLGEITIGMLRQTFPQWRIFAGDGQWWAVRSGLEKWDGPESLLLRALTAPDLVALAERLCVQDWLGTLDADALAEVYRGTLTERPQ
jgi:hypothetical protein